VVTVADLAAEMDVLVRNRAAVDRALEIDRDIEFAKACGELDPVLDPARGRLRPIGREALQKNAIFPRKPPKLEFLLAQDEAILQRNPNLRHFYGKQ